MPCVTRFSISKTSITFWPIQILNRLTWTCILYIHASLFSQTVMLYWATGCLQSLPTKPANTIMRTLVKPFTPAFKLGVWSWSYKRFRAGPWTNLGVYYETDEYLVNATTPGEWPLQWTGSRNGWMWPIRLFVVQKSDSPILHSWLVVFCGWHIWGTSLPALLSHFFPLPGRKKCLRQIAPSWPVGCLYGTFWCYAKESQCP